MRGDQSYICQLVRLRSVSRNGKGALPDAVEPDLTGSPTTNRIASSVPKRMR